MAKKLKQSRLNGQSMAPVVRIQTTVSDAEMLRSRTSLGMSAPKPKAKTATPSKARTAKSSPAPMTVTARPGVIGLSGTAYSSIGKAVRGELGNPTSPIRQAASRAVKDIRSSRDTMMRGAVNAANARDKARKADQAARKADKERVATNKAFGNTSNMPAPDMRGKTKRAPTVTVSRPAPAAIPRPAPLRAAQSTSNLPAGGYSPRTMSGDNATRQPTLDTNKGYEPNKTGFFDKLHRSLGGKGNATYSYPTGDNRSDKD